MSKSKADSTFKKSSSPGKTLQRGTHTLASGLTLFAQRLPFIKEAALLVESLPCGFRLAAPIGVQYVATHTVSGASTKIVPAAGSTNPTSATVGQAITPWIFRTQPETAHDYTLSGLPAGITFTFDPNAAGGYQALVGTPTAAGNFNVAITAWRYPDHSGGSEAKTTYNLTMNISGAALPPFQVWVQAQGWTPAELSDPNITGPDADPEGDGIANTLEYVLDLDPRSHDPFPGTLTEDPSSPATHLRYTLPLNPAATDATVGFQKNPGLGSSPWTDIAEGDPEFPVTRTATSISVRIPKTLACQFIRLAASL